MHTVLRQRLDTLGDALERASPSLAFAYLFGSTVTGTAGPRSDVDLAIYVDETADAHRCRLEIARVAADHLGTDHVDVVLLNGAPLSLAGRVLTTRRVLVDRDPFRRHRYESLTARMFQDFRAREHRLLAERFGRG